MWNLNRNDTDVLCVHAKSPQPCLNSATPWTVGSTRLLSPWGFSRQEYLSGLPFPSPGESSRSRDRTRVSYVSCIDRWVLYHLGSPKRELAAHNWRI